MKIKIDRALARETYVDSANRDPQKLREAVETFREANPAMVMGYTQALAIWARWIDDHGLRDWKDVPVVAQAEAVLPIDRAPIQKVFGQIFETYGSRETMLMAAECPLHKGMHLSEENILLETVDKNGNPVPDGTTGEVLVTDLNNYGMSLIRYQNGDLSTIDPNGTKCPCMRGLRKLIKVDGRRADNLLASNGTEVPGMVLSLLFSIKAKDVARQVQLVQRKDGSVVLNIVPDTNYKPETIQPIVDAIKDALGQRVDINPVRDIPPAANGKQKIVVRE